MLPTVATQISRQTLNRLCSIRVSNFMTVLLGLGNGAFEMDMASIVPAQPGSGNPRSQAIPSPTIENRYLSVDTRSGHRTRHRPRPPADATTHTIGNTGAPPVSICGSFVRRHNEDSPCHSIGDP